jgi:tRNA A-37 threonylcarbamoyl transferase component Bud32
LRSAPPEGRLALLRRILEFLQTLHAGGGWHGAAQPRNFTQIGDRLGLIDFEDDVEPSMPLFARQARDIAIFAMSAARFPDTDGKLMETLLADAHRRASADVEAMLDALGRQLARVHRLVDAVPAWVGRDPRALAVLAGAYKRFLGLDGSARRATLP